MFVVHSPLRIILPRVRVKDKIWILNLNVYRNTHYQILNQVKEKYERLMKDQIMALPVFKTVEAVFINYPKTAAIPDTANVCCIHEKFFADALVKYGKLEDDKPEFWKGSRYYFGEIDRVNPRVGIALREAKPRKLPII